MKCEAQVLAIFPVLLDEVSLAMGCSLLAGECPQHTPPSFQ